MFLHMCRFDPLCIENMGKGTGARLQEERTGGRGTRAHGASAQGHGQSDKGRVLRVYGKEHYDKGTGSRNRGKGMGEFARAQKRKKMDKVAWETAHR